MHRIFFCLLYIVVTFIIYPQSYPDWVLTPPVSDTEIYSIGIASSKNKQMGITSASALSRAELSRIVSVRVMNQLVNMSEETKGSSSSYSKTVSAQISETILKGAKIDKIHEDISTKPPTYYVLSVITLEDLRRSFSTLTDEKARELLSTSIEPLKAIDREPSVAKDSSVAETPISARTTIKEAEPKSGKSIPSWVKKFPSSKDYYIGIGEASILRAAQDGAVTMIISQIRAKVQAEMKTFMQETNGATEETFSQVIKMSLMENVEDLEYVDAFFNEKDNVYYAYYRLNIEEYKRKQAEKERIATEKALDLLERSASETDPSLSLKHILIGYITIAPYSAKDIRVNFQGKQVLLVNELMGRLQKTMQNISISSPSNTVSTSLINHQPLTIPFTVQYEGKAVAYLPFTFINSNGNIDMVGRSVTDKTGLVQTIINKPGSGAGLKTIKIVPDILSFMKDYIDEETAFFYLNMITGLGLPTKEVLLEVKPPVFGFNVHINGSVEAHKDRVMVALSEFKNSFEKQSGAKFIDGKSDFVIDVSILSTTTLSELSKQYFTRMTVTIAVIDTVKKEEIFTKSTSEIKGGNISEVRSVQSVVENYIKSYNADLVTEVLSFFSMGNN